MKKWLIFIVSVLILIILFKIFVYRNIAPSVSSSSNFYITIRSNTLTNSGTNIIITNNSNKVCEFGDEYSLEKKEFGIWKKLKMLNKNVWWNANSYELLSGEEHEEKINWQDTYGNLKNGEYRLIKIINGERIAVEFTIKN